MDGILGYPSLPRQQLLALDPNIYGGEPFRHGLTPPAAAALESSADVAAALTAALSAEACQVASACD